MGRTLSPKQTALLLDPKPVEQVSGRADQIDPSSYGSPRSKNAFIDKFAKTDSQAMSQLVKQRQQQMAAGSAASGNQKQGAPSVTQSQEIPKHPDIPRFYFPEGKPKDPDHVKATEEAIDKIFAEKIELKKEDFEQITTEVCSMPKFFKNMLFDRIDSGKTGKITKPHFLQFWKRDF